MSSNYPPRSGYEAYPSPAYSHQIQPGQYLSRATIVMTGLGAVVGGASAAARNIRRVKTNEIDRREAVADTAREMAGAGVATGLASVVMSTLNAGMAVSLLGTTALAIGAKYVWDGILTQESAPCHCCDGK